MKKQINPNIKAHLIRSSFYVLLLLAVCVIPFALAQRNTPKASKPSAAKSSTTVDKAQIKAARDRAKSVPSSLVGKRQLISQRKSASDQAQLRYDVRRAPSMPRVSQLPLRSSGPTGAGPISVPPQPKGVQVVLYDQYDNAGGTASLSATFTDFPTFSSDLADDFVVPGGQTWNVDSIDADGLYFNGAGPATDWNVFIYTDSGGLPGTQIYSTTNISIAQVGTTFTASLVPAAVLSAGTYWIEIQANMTFGTQGEWGWSDRTVQSNNSAAFQNPGGGLGVCPSWTAKLVCIPTATGPDQVYRINGTTGGGGTPTPTPPPGCNNYIFTTGADAIVPGDTDIGNNTDDGDTFVALPFSFQLYDQTFNGVNASSNGRLDFVCINEPGGFLSGCIPPPDNQCPFDYTIFPNWSDYRTDIIGEGCANFPGGVCGIFTSVSGSAPNRIFNIEWRAVYFADHTQTANFEARLYESDPNHRFDFVFGDVQPGSDELYVSGVEQNGTSFTEDFCDAGPPAPGSRSYTCVGGGGSPTPTPSGTPVCVPGPWQEQAPMPIDLYGAAGASDGTFFYAAGGYSFSQVPPTQAVFNRYDPVANTWTPLTDMPQSAIEALAVYYPPTNKIYVFGGEDGDSGVNYNITRIYDVASGTWTTGANMPDVRSFMAGGYVPATGMIYVASGYSTGQVTDAQPTTWQYDPVADAWTDLTGTDPYPHAAGGFAYGVINDKLYVAGGRDANIAIINDTYEFDPQAAAGSRYTQKADEPGTFQNNVPGSGAAQGVLWVYGGGNPFVAGPETDAGIAAPMLGRVVSKPSSALAFAKKLFGFGPKTPDTANSGRFYDPATDTWNNSPNMNETRAFVPSAAIGNSLIIAAGGYNGIGTVASVETESICSGGGGSPTPTPTPSGCTVSGSIDGSDPTQTDRLFRSGIPQTCPPTTTCATFGDGLPHHFDEYTFTNTTGATQCVTVDTDTACTGTNFIFIASYLGSFDPANICTNWIGDSGSSPDIGVPAPFSFDLDDGQTVVIVVSEVTPDAGCAGYTVNVSGICGGGISPTPSPTCIPGSPNGAAGPWTAGNPYPNTIARYGFVQTATHFYVFGGVTDGFTTSAVNRMSLATGTWEPRAASPFSGEAPTCALDASTGIAYCTDGLATNGFASYDTNTDTWTTLASDPFATDHYGSASGAFNGKVFVAGGTGAETANVDVYDIASNTWSAGTAAPTVFLLAGYQQVGQFLYVIGGWDLGSPGANKTTSYRLDMSSAPGVWETGPTFTQQRSDFALAYDPGTNKLYALGGDANGGGFFDSTSLVDELDVSAWPGGTWNPSPPDLPLPNRQGNQAGFNGNGDIWSVGGLDGSTFLFNNEVWHRNNGGGVVCPSPTPTITPPISPTPTITPPISPTPTITPPISPTPTITPPISPTPSATPTPSPTRPPPTPRPRPTPYPRPTP